MAGELKDQRVVTMMSPTELEAIDDWMFRNRIRSRGEAIRRLCHIAMTSEAEIEALVSRANDTSAQSRKLSHDFTRFLRSLVKEIPFEKAMLKDIGDSARALASSATDMLLKVSSLSIASESFRTITALSEAEDEARKAHLAYEEFKGVLEKGPEALFAHVAAIIEKVERDAAESEQSASSEAPLDNVKSSKRKKPRTGGEA